MLDEDGLARAGAWRGKASPALPERLQLVGVARTLAFLRSRCPAWDMARRQSLCGVRWSQSHNCLRPREHRRVGVDRRPCEESCSFLKFVYAFAEWLYSVDDSVNVDGRKYIFAYGAAATLVQAHAARPSRIIIGLSGWLSRSFLCKPRSSAETCVGVRAQPQSSDNVCAPSSSFQNLTGRKDDERNAVSHACDGVVVLGQ